MKSIVAHAAKDIRLEEQERPEPQTGKVLVRLAAGGICGSDLHYYHNGGFGAVKLREPMILGHEVSGWIEDTGGFEDLKVGQLVAISPSRPCGACSYCESKEFNHCLDMRFYGSAMPFPHIQGAFREFVLVNKDQCFPAGGLSTAEAAMAEPLSVVLHAAKRAGDLKGKRVLVTGCGPIGLLAILTARAFGAAEIVATDISEFTLAAAKAVGADRILNVSDKPDALEEFHPDKGHFNVLIECSGVASALASAVPAMRPRGIIMQLGLGGDMVLPVQAMTAKELELRGSFRFHEEFGEAVDLMASGRIDVKPLLTHKVTIEDCVKGFELASDRSKAIKVQIEFAT